MLGSPVLNRAGGGCEEVNVSVKVIWLVVKTSPSYGSHFMGKANRHGPIKTSDSNNLECA